HYPRLPRAVRRLHRRLPPRPPHRPPFLRLRCLRCVRRQPSLPLPLLSHPQRLAPRRLLRLRPRRPALPSASFDLPTLPDDSESCIGGVERALRDRGVELPRVNGTCDAAYCFCGVRLRRLACAGAFVANATEGRWVPAGDSRRRLERDCARPGFSGCTRCLRTLNQVSFSSPHLSSLADSLNSRSDKKATPAHDRECQLMGVTWLLSKNRTLFLPATTSVLRVLMAADVAGRSDPTSCSLSLDDMPLAVGSDQIGGHGG
ncbi:unnamed protein product, partial [Musa textilis]